MTKSHSQSLTVTEETDFKKIRNFMSIKWPVVKPSYIYYPMLLNPYLSNHQNRLWNLRFVLSLVRRKKISVDWCTPAWHTEDSLQKEKICFVFYIPGSVHIANFDTFWIFDRFYSQHRLCYIPNDVWHQEQAAGSAVWS